jgi:hypothetical protein
MLFNSVYAVTSFGVPIFESIYGIVDTNSFITARTTIDLIAIVDPLSQILAIFIVPLFKRKLLLVVSFFIVGVLNVLVGIMDGANTD